MSPADLVRLVDALEDKSDAYLTLESVQEAAGEEVGWAIEAQLLLVDYRQRLDGDTVKVCRLNRRHPLIMRLTQW